MWEINTDQEPHIKAVEGYHSNLRLLHEQAWDNYKVKRSDYIRLLIELTRHQEQSRYVSDDHSTESTSVHLERCDRKELRARIAKHIVSAAREPRRTMEERFAQGRAISIVQNV